MSSQLIFKILPFLLSIYLSSAAVANPVATSKMELEATKANLAGKYQQAISIWTKLLQQPELKTDTKANIYTNLAALYQQIGRAGKAISTWHQAISIYRQQENQKYRALLAAVLVDKAQAHNSLGQTDFSRTLLTEAIEIAQQENLTEIEAVGNQAMGNVRFIAGEYEQAIFAYLKSLAAAQKIDESKLIVVALNNLSNSYHQKYQQACSLALSAQESGNILAEDLWRQSSTLARKAWHYAKEAAKESESSPTLYSVEAILQLVKLSKTYSQRGIVEPVTVEDNLKQAHEILLTLPNSQRKAQALIKLAHLQENSVSSLELALKVSESIGHLPTQSLALGYLGAYYEQKQDYERALQLTYRAQQTAGQINAANILYRWDWQAGRIHRTLGQHEDAMRAYQQALASLQLIRSELATGNKELTRDFQLEVEPVYRELIELLLTEKHSEPTPRWEMVRNPQHPSRSKIRQALEVKDLLHLSELENFFGDDCLIVKSERVKTNSPQQAKTTVINTIILESNTYIILQLPDGRVKSFSLPISSQQMNQMVKQWRYDLENQENDNYLSLSRKLYQLLIKPIEPELAASETEQLVFVNDGILRNVPMAALQDGEKFLIEKYPLANSLGFDLKLNEAESSKVNNVLAFGLTVGSPQSPPLPYVREELAKINLILMGLSLGRMLN